MIGSPWNPFFDQVIPGTSKRYDGRSVDFVDDNQSGGFDAIRLPQHVELEFNRQIVDPSVNTQNKVILTRRYEMVANRDRFISSQVATYGILYNTALVQSIRRTGFMWWHRPSVPWNDTYPRVIYESDTLADFDNYVFNSDDSRDSTRGFRYRLGAGFSHAGIPFNSESSIFPPPSDWSVVWSLWLTDDYPVDEGGTPEHWAFAPVIAGSNPDIHTYPLWVAVGNVNTDIPEGSRLESSIDLNRRSELRNVTTSLKGDEIYVKPWYREG